MNPEMSLGRGHGTGGKVNVSVQSLMNYAEAEENLKGGSDFLSRQKIVMNLPLPLVDREGLDLIPSGEFTLNIRRAECGLIYVPAGLTIADMMELSGNRLTTREPLISEVVLSDLKFNRIISELTTGSTERYLIFSRRVITATIGEHYVYQLQKLIEFCHSYFGDSDRLKEARQSFVIWEEEFGTPAEPTIFHNGESRRLGELDLSKQLRPSLPQLVWIRLAYDRINHRDPWPELRELFSLTNSVLDRSFISVRVDQSGGLDFRTIKPDLNLVNTGALLAADVSLWEK